MPLLPEPPRGIFPARLDETGRLELPEEWRQYLAAVGGSGFRLYWHGDHLEVVPEETYQARRQAAANMPLEGEHLATLKRAGVL